MKAYCPNCGGKRYDMNYNCELCGSKMRFESKYDEIARLEAENKKLIDEYRKICIELALDRGDSPEQAIVFAEEKIRELKNG